MGHEGSSVEGLGALHVQALNFFEPEAIQFLERLATDAELRKRCAMYGRVMRPIDVKLREGWATVALKHYFAHYPPPPSDVGPTKQSGTAVWFLVRRVMTVAKPEWRVRSKQTDLPLVVVDAMRSLFDLGPINRPFFRGRST